MVQVGSDTNWDVVAAGDNRTVAIKTGGTLWAWGTTVGDGTTSTRTSPVPIGANGAIWTSVSSGPYSTFAIKNDGTLWAWGFNDYGQLGLGDQLTHNSPEEVIF